MRDTDHSDLCARRVLVPDLLNLARIGINPPRGSILLPVDDTEIAILVNLAQVAEEPAGAHTSTSPPASAPSSRSASRGRDTRPGWARGTCSLVASTTSALVAATPAGVAVRGSAIDVPPLSTASPWPRRTAGKCASVLADHGLCSSGRSGGPGGSGASHAASQKGWRALRVHRHSAARVSVTQPPAACIRRSPRRRKGPRSTARTVAGTSGCSPGIPGAW